jgi:hypothetical protein
MPGLDAIVEAGPRRLHKPINAILLVYGAKYHSMRHNASCSDFGFWIYDFGLKIDVPTFNPLYLLCLPVSCLMSFCSLIILPRGTFLAAGDV